MDLLSLKPETLHESGAWFTLLNPKTKEETDIRVKIKGCESKTFKSAFGKTQGDDLDLAQITKLSLEFYSKIVIDWENIEIGGEVLEFSKSNVKKLMDDYDWIAEQVITQAYNKPLFF